MAKREWFDRSGESDGWATRFVRGGALSVSLLYFSENTIHQSVVLESHGHMLAITEAAAFTSKQLMKLAGSISKNV